MNTCWPSLKMKIAKIYNWTILFYLTAVTILTFRGNIYFGNGLGDLFYLYLTGLLATAQLVFLLISQRQKFRLTTLFLFGTVFLLMAIYITWQFTTGRGNEFPWNGNIFYSKVF